MGLFRSRKKALEESKKLEKEHIPTTEELEAENKEFMQEAEIAGKMMPKLKTRKKTE